MEDLTQKKCVPCKGGEDPLDEETIEILLREVASGWGRSEDGWLVRNVKLDDFMEVMDLVNEIAQLAEEEGHHPNLCVHDYNQLLIELYTHKINGLHENDFIMAAKIDELL